jgi:hypothetical protein
MDINTNSDYENQTGNMYDFINHFLFNPMLVGILFGVIILYIVISYSLGSGSNMENGSSNNNLSFESNSSSDSSSKLIGIIFLILLFLMIVSNAYFYYYGVSIISSIQNIISNGYDNGNSNESDLKLEIHKSDNDNDKDETENNQIKLRPQVFNIPENKFTYDDANAVCKSYDAELATYNQIEDAYNKGASWCSQGWSEGQNIFYPTQEKLFNDLQKIKGHEHDCGRIGINGGYISNPKARFGVNCYGRKPQMTPDEEYIMENKPVYPLTQEDILFQKRVDYWKKHITDIIVSPFNPTTWSKF